MRREKVRLAAAAMYEQDMKPREVAHELRVSTKSAYQWRRRWPRRARAGLRARLGPAQLARLRAALDQGPAVQGWREDQRWTLERVTILIGRLFHVRYTLRGTSYFAAPYGFTPQVPVHRACACRNLCHLAGCSADRWLLGHASGTCQADLGCQSVG